MIELKVEKYCSNCPNFIPVAEKTSLQAGYDEFHDTTIYCENRDICENIRKYLEKEKDENGNGIQV